jgi:hypothetical protein
MDARGGCAAFSVAGIENGKALGRPKAEANRRRHNHSPDGSEVEGEMTDEPHLRLPCQAGRRARLDVWDRQTKGPGKASGQSGRSLAEEQAREIADKLTRNFIAKG